MSIPEERRGWREFMSGYFSMRKVLLLALAICPGGMAVGADAGLMWSTHVRPILDLHCVKCHGPIERKSGLELDTPEAVLKGGDEGPAVVPGEPDKSRLYQFLAPGADPHMPPKKQLSDADREMIRGWMSAMSAGKGGATNPPVAAVGEPRRVGLVLEAGESGCGGGW